MQLSKSFAFSLPNFGDYWSLTKPRVVAMIVFTVIASMALAYVSTNTEVIFWQFLSTTIGIGLAAAGAAVINCLVEKQVDARMLRTHNRPTAAGKVATVPTLIFAFALLSTGLIMLQYATNTITTLLTFGTFVGYAIVYTIFLKPATPQNIVIGGASGAMPPVLGWAAVTGSVDYQALILFLIIFVWTPPHFWSLALYRLDDYKRSGYPMLPVTHGTALTRLHILLYTIALFAICLLPFATGMASWLYLCVAVVTNGKFIFLACQLYTKPSDAKARHMFAYSCSYLLILFTGLILDVLLLPH